MLAIDQTAAEEKPTAKFRLAVTTGEKIGLSGGTVLKYYAFSSAINTLFSESEELARRILSGKLRVSHENTIELSRLTADEVATLAQTIAEENIDHLTFSDIRSEVEWHHTQPKAPVSRKEKKEQRDRIEAGIRQMPAFDPDAEVNSLCMTISSWVSSIDRVDRSTDFNHVSNRAKLKLMKQLTILETAVNTMQKSLVGREIR